MRADFPTLISPVQARQFVLRNTPQVQIETVPLHQTLGRTLARDIVSPFDLPPFDNSAMDGYAVNIEDFATNKAFSLRLQGVSAAGDRATTLTSGHCQKIMTGAPLPSGADAVVMREETREENGSVHFESAPQKGENIRRAGNDVARGEIPLRAGEQVRVPQWALLAALGQAQVAVARIPRVGIIITGDELVEVGQTLRDGQIYDSNSYALRGLIEECGARIVHCERSGDTPENFARTLNEIAPHCDMVVTSGGVSMGDFDPVRDVLPQVAQVHFWKIAMKPGKPVMFATLQGRNSDGARVPVFGLPGNPVSVFVSFELLVRPALLQMQGHTALHRVQLTVRMQENGKSPLGKTDYQRAYVTPDGNGEWHAQLSGEQGSGRLTTLTRANALVIVPPETTAWQAGEELPALMTDWPEM